MTLRSMLSLLIRLSGVKPQLSFKPEWINTRELHHCQPFTRFIGSHLSTRLFSFCFWWDCLFCLFCGVWRMIWGSNTLWYYSYSWTRVNLIALFVYCWPHVLPIHCRCSSGDEEEDKEVGWKYIHGDVFRYPQNISLFSAVMGVGNQLLTM